MVLLSMVFISSCRQSSEKGEMNGKETAEVIYTCSMHPEVESPEPGKCAKCGMDLVKKGSDHEEMDHEHGDSTHHE